MLRRKRHKPSLPFSSTDAFVPTPNTSTCSISKDLLLFPSSIWLPSCHDINILESVSSSSTLRVRCGTELSLDGRAPEHQRSKMLQRPSGDLSLKVPSKFSASSWRIKRTRFGCSVGFELKVSWRVSNAAFLVLASSQRMGALSRHAITPRLAPRANGLTWCRTLTLHGRTIASRS